MSRFGQVGGLTPSMTGTGIVLFCEPRNHAVAVRDGHVRGLTPAVPKGVDRR
jgi:hypothetical protein